MRHLLSAIVFSSLAVTANANLPEPMGSMKNAYVNCLNAVITATQDAGNPITEPLMRSACPNELASLKAVVPDNMEAAFLEQLEGEIMGNLHSQIVTPTQ